MQSEHQLAALYCERFANYVTRGVAPSEFLPQSRAAVMKALELDETVEVASCPSTSIIPARMIGPFDLINRKLEARPDTPALHEWLGLVYEQERRAESEKRAPFSILI
jgi:hypothetical protein